MKWYQLPKIFASIFRFQDSWAPCSIDSRIGGILKMNAELASFKIDAWKYPSQNNPNFPNAFMSIPITMTRYMFISGTTWASKLPVRLGCLFPNAWKHFQKCLHRQIEEQFSHSAKNTRRMGKKRGKLLWKRDTDRLTSFPDPLRIGIEVTKSGKQTTIQKDPV